MVPCSSQRSPWDSERPDASSRSLPSSFPADAHPAESASPINYLPTDSRLWFWGPQLRPQHSESFYGALDALCRPSSCLSPQGAPGPLLRACWGPHRSLRSGA